MSLDNLYTRFSEKWHRMMVKLGYLEAYRQLVQFDCDRRSRVAESVADIGTGTGALSIAFLEKIPTLKS